MIALCLTLLASDAYLVPHRDIDWHAFLKRYPDYTWLMMPQDRDMRDCANGHVWDLGREDSAELRAYIYEHIDPAACFIYPYGWWWTFGDVLLLDEPKLEPLPQRR